jgi:hypothetical protein
MTLGAERSLRPCSTTGRRFTDAGTAAVRLARAIGVVSRTCVAVSLAGLGHHGLASGNLTLAESSFRRALEIRRQIHPPDHGASTRLRCWVLPLRRTPWAAEPDLLAAWGLRASSDGR